MRTSSVISISLPTAMLKEASRLAKKSHMTRSEYLRASLRVRMEEQLFADAVLNADQARREGKMKVLRPGDLTKMMKAS